MKKFFIPPVLILISLFLIIFFYFSVKKWNVIKFPFNLSGILIAFTGFIFMGKAHELFSKYKTTLYFEKSTFLIEEGIFSKSRNPLYIGMFLLLLGIAVCFQNIISLLIPFVFILIIIFHFIPLEEKMMAEAFGEKYLDYKKKTPRLF